jgi:hypothetical protein
MCNIWSLFRFEPSPSPAEFVSGLVIATKDNQKRLEKEQQDNHRAEPDKINLKTFYTPFSPTQGSKGKACFDKYLGCPERQ